MAITLIVLVCCSPSTLAQKKTKKEYPAAVLKHQIVGSIGYGYPSILRAYLRSVTNRKEYTISGVGPLLVKAEYLINPKFGVGINATYSHSKVSWMQLGYDTISKTYHDFDTGLEGSELSVTFRGNYHFWHRKKIDSYAGLGVGYGKIFVDGYTKAHTGGFVLNFEIPRPICFEATWGLRYFPIKNLGFYTEVGLGKSWLLFQKYFIPEAILQGGICLKF